MLQQWPKELQVAQVRMARPTDQLKEIERFYLDSANVFCAKAQRQQIQNTPRLYHECDFFHSQWAYKRPLNQDKAPGGCHGF